MTSEKLKVFSFSGSFHCQKVLLALNVKEADFEISNVDVLNGGQYEPEFMTLNPAGQVPMLKDGKQVVTESDKIIEYIDREVTTGLILIPSLKTKDGKEIEKWRKMLERVKVDMLTTGIVMHPELSVSETKFPKQMTAADLQNYRQQTVSKLEKLSVAHPDLKTAYLNKIDQIKTKFEDSENTMSKENIKKALDELETILDYTEQQLRRSMEKERSKDVYLFGNEMNIIDITMTALFELLRVLGLSNRYLGPDKRRYLYRYYQLLSQNPAVQKTGILKLPRSTRIEILE